MNSLELLIIVVESLGNNSYMIRGIQSEEDEFGNN